MSAVVESRSIHFGRCVGVFEGGGIRGAAHAGAFAACVSHGINFEATVGASAGSMIAVLIAAGLSPSQVIEELSFDFGSLLIPSEVRGVLSNVAVHTARLFGSNVRSIAHALAAPGLYSSAPLREWMNGVLRKYLPKSNDLVTFCTNPLQYLRRTCLVGNPRYGRAIVIQPHRSPTLSKLRARYPFSSSQSAAKQLCWWTGVFSAICQSSSYRI